MRTCRVAGSKGRVEDYCEEIPVRALCEDLRHKTWYGIWSKILDPESGGLVASCKCAHDRGVRDAPDVDLGVEVKGLECDSVCGYAITTRSNFFSCSPDLCNTGTAMWLPLYLHLTFRSLPFNLPDLLGDTG